MKYKAKSGFELKDVAGELLLMPRGADTVDYNYVTVFNEAGALIYRAMNEFTDIDTLAQLLVEKYSIGADEAKADVQAYVDKMLNEGFAEAE